MTAAQQLAVWLETIHPEIYSQLQSHAQQATQRHILSRTRLRGFGQDDGSIDLSSLADDSNFPDSGDTITVVGDAIASPDMTPIDTSTFSTPLDVTSDIAAPMADTLPVTSGSGPSFLEQLGSGITQTASGVANFLTSPQGLTAVTNLGTAYFAATASATNAKTQNAVLQAQIAQTAMGRSPYPISYAQSGSQLIPVYHTPAIGSGSVAPIPAALANAIASGQSQYVPGVGYTIPENTLSGLTGMSLSSVLPWLLIIGVAVALLSR